MELVKLVTAPSEPIAQMWCEILQKEGVPAFAKLPGAGSPALDGAADLEGCWVMVREDDLDKAATILDSMTRRRQRRKRR